MTLKKWFKRLAIACIVITGGLAAVLAVLMHQLEATAVKVLESKFPDLAFSIDSIKIHRHGEIDVSAATIRHRDAVRPALKIASFQIGFQWSNLLDGKIDWLVLDAPEGIIDDQLLAAFFSPSTNHSQSNASLVSHSRWHIPEISIQNGKAQLQLEGLPDVGFFIEVRPVSTDSSTTHTTVWLSDIHLAPGDSTITQLALEIDLSNFLTRRNIHQISLSGVNLNITQKLLDLFHSPSSASSLSGDSNPLPASPSPSAISSQPWTLDQLVVENSHVALSALRSEVPDIEFDIHATLSHLTTARTGGDADRLQRITFSDFNFAGGASDSFAATIDTITIDLSLAGLRAAQIESIAFATPVVTISQAASSGRVASSGAGNSGLPVNPTLSSDPPSAKLPSWTLNHFTLTDGEFYVTNLGPTMPETSLKFSADWQQVSTDPTASGASHPLNIFDVRLASPHAPLTPFLLISQACAELSIDGILNHTIDTLTINAGSELIIDRPLLSLLSPAQTSTPLSSSTSTTQYPATPWLLSALTLNDLHITIANLGEGIPNLSFLFATAMEDLPLSSEGLHARDEIQQIEITDFTIPSPFDPWAPVATMNSIFVRFSLAQLLRQEIEELTILQPTIYIGADLFWYVDELKRKKTAEQSELLSAGGLTSKTTPPNWKLHKFTASSGTLAISTDGAARVNLPIGFNSEAENIHFSSLNDLQLKLNIIVPKETYPFPAYELELRDLYGDIEFGLPPASGASNLVQTLYSSAALWKQFRGQDIWLSVTYDREGIYSTFGGSFYEGYINGGFTFYLIDNFPWIGWITGTNLQMQPLTDVLTPDAFSLSGPASLEVQINAQSAHIQRAVGWITLNDSGTMKIEKLNGLLDALPSDWSSLKHDLTTIGLETLRDFEYQRGRSDFWFIENHGQLTLQLNSPHGARNFDILIHDSAEKPIRANPPVQSQP